MFEALFEGLFPPGVALAWERSDAPAAALFPEEEALVARAVPKRRLEFAQGRACARRLLAELGVPAAPLLSGEMREPLWPAGVVGSITHDRALCAVVAARADAFAGLGIDLEPDEPLEPGVAARIWSPEEASDARLRAVVPFESAAKLVFSAKEAVYKCQFPTTHAYIGFGGVSVRLGDGAFEATLTESVGVLPRGHRFIGTWRRVAGEIATAAWLAPPSSL
ncbi:MAG TPA: 4'-phosphopantetheinyl transferase superfamily protein [Polyangiaceae bacterium]|nr:4'-phosphopantetheinyl transferase superfamily protein [Polyangiaceae bacterium]